MAKAATSDEKPRPNDAPDDITETSQTVAASQLRAFLERIERLEEEKKTIADDIKDVFAEAKGSGYNAKAMRDILKERKLDREKAEEHRAIVNLYASALGMDDIFG